MRFSTRMRVAATSATATAAALLHAARHGRTQQMGAPRVRLRAGDPAPEFALPASNGSEYHLADYRGRQRVVIAWFPKAFTGGCTRECESLARHRRRLEQTGAAIFGANCDSPATNREFADALGLEFPILSDVDGTVARAYGVLAAGGLPSRWTFYIGTDGRILSIDTNVRVGTSGSDIEDTLQRLQGRPA